jgi:hypothetical protein
MRAARAILFTCLLFVFGSWPAPAADSHIFSKLAASRDALLAQQREIQRSYDDVARQIDELKAKQAMLDTYSKETQTAIREVERAMDGGQ